MTFQLHRITRHAAAAVAVVAFAAPAAQAVSPDDRPYARSESAAATQGSLSPDDRAFYRGNSTDLLTPKSLGPDDRPLVRSEVQPPSAPVHVMVHSGGFDWSDAGIGAAGGAGLILLLAGTWLLARQVRREPRLA